jgi:hypothetical protein
MDSPRRPAEQYVERAQTMIGSADLVGPSGNRADLLNVAEEYLDLADKTGPADPETRDKIAQLRRRITSLRP